MNIIQLPSRSPAQAEIKTAFVNAINDRLKNLDIFGSGMYIGTICTLSKFFGENLRYCAPRFPETRREPKAILLDIIMDLIFIHPEDIRKGGVKFILDYFFSEFEGCDLTVQILKEDFDRVKNLARGKD